MRPLRPRFRVAVYPLLCVLSLALLPLQPSVETPVLNGDLDALGRQLGLLEPALVPPRLRAGA